MISTISQIKARVSILDVISWNGVSLNGRGKIPCPLPGHDDKDPSFLVYEKTNSFNCFGCHRGGDLITLHALLKGISNSEAIKELAHKFNIPMGNFDPVRYKKQQDEKARVQEVFNAFQKLCKDELKNNNNMQAFCVKKWGFGRDIQEKFGFGYCTKAIYSKLFKTIKAKRLKQAGLLGETGWKVFENRIVLPYFDYSNKTVYFIGRLTKPEKWGDIDAPKYVKSLTKTEKNPNVSETVKNVLYIIRGSGEIVYNTEGIADAISIHQATGVTVIAPVTVSFNSKDIPKIATVAKRFHEVIIINDNEVNESGEKGAHKTVHDLRKHGVTGIKLIELSRPEGVEKIDINDFLRDPTEEKKQEFQGLPRRKLWEIMAEELTLDNLIDKIEPIFKEILEEEGETTGKILAKKLLRNMKIKERDLPDNMKFFSNLVKAKKQEKEETIDQKIIKKVEEQKEPLSDEDRQKAEEMAKNPRIFEEISTDIKTLGIVGEEDNSLMVYLAGTSRLMSKPLKLNLRGDPSTGKNYITDGVLSLFPESEKVNASRMTRQALAYMEKEALKHKILLIQEEEGSEDGNYNLRILQSEDGIITHVVVKDPKTGTPKTVKMEVLGPTATITTTNKIKLYEDNETRIIVLYVDTSEKQTKRVCEAVKHKESIYQGDKEEQKEQIRRKHHAFQQTLEPLDVVIPFYKYINFPTKQNRARRDITAFSAIIKAVAFINQKQKEIKPEGYIEADINDYGIAYGISKKILDRTLSGMHPNARKLLVILQDLWERKIEKLTPKQALDYSFTHKNIERETGLSGSFIRKYMEALRQTIYLKVANKGGKGATREYRYRMDIQPEDDIQEKGVGITTPEELAKLLEGKIVI
ncbi:MAG: toprim domain-containing protein [Candidatus Eremiobacteraeota bacterium]|nr:toprim domain-containing protein [Candidatus Eremiobacteraeota bacterium]